MVILSSIISLRGETGNKRRRGSEEGEKANRLEKWAAEGKEWGKRAQHRTRKRNLNLSIIYKNTEEVERMPLRHSFEA